MASRIREMIAAREHLLLDVSHELRSPLTRLRVALELLPASEQRTRMVTDIAEMDDLIGGLLELERLRGGQGLTRVRTDLVPIVREVAGSFATCVPAAHVSGSPAAVFAEVDVVGILYGPAQSRRQRDQILVAGQPVQLKSRSKSARRTCWSG